METARFRWGINELYAYFGRRPLTDAQERVYWEAVRRYSDAVWTRTVTELLRSSRPVPAAFPSPQDLRSACQRTMEGSQEAEERTPEHYCSECGGRGFLESYHADDPMQYATVVRCGHCENWRRRYGPHLPIRTRQELEARGRIVLGRRFSRQEWDEPARIVAEDMTRAIAANMARRPEHQEGSDQSWAQYLRRIGRNELF